MIDDSYFTIWFRRAALVLLLLTGNNQLTAFAQGSLIPPGAPSPTMKSLAQIEPRIPISSAPFNITQPGSYYLTTNVICTASNAIVIATNGVTLDLSGFTIFSTVANAANGGTAILLNSNVSDITIYNGHIRGGVTNNGSGVYFGSGFGSGIYFAGGFPVNVRVSGVTVSKCLYYGIYLSTGDSTIVEACVVRTVGSYGISASTIKSSVAVDCGNTAISGDQVSDSRGESSGSGNGLSAGNAQNCYGSSSSNWGLFADTAQNCYGFSSSNVGLEVSYVAENCIGRSTTYYGVSTSIAQNCYGYGSGSSPGLYANYANTCYGYSSGGTGLVATYGNFCFGSSVSVTTKYNMP